MEPHARYTLVGIVTLGLAALTAFGLVWLRRGSAQNVDQYTVYFERHSLRGLRPDGLVTMRGIEVGRVQTLEISDPDIERVRVVVELRGGTPVKTDTLAIIERNLLTGIASIDLLRSSRKAPRLTERPEGEKHPVMGEGPADIEALRETLPDVLSSAQSFATRAAELFSDTNRERFSNTLTNLDVFTGRLTTEQEKFDRFIDEATVAIADLRTLAETVDTSVRKASDKPLDEATLLIEELRHLVVTLDAATREVMTTQTSNIARLVDDLSRASASLANVLEDFENPRSIISGPGPSALGPGEAENP